MRNRRLLALFLVSMIAGCANEGVRRTETQIRFLHSVLMKHHDEFVKKARNENIPIQVLAFADNNADRARIIWIKTRLMEAFPVRFSEIQEAYFKAPLLYIPQKSRQWMGDYQDTLLKRNAAKSQPRTESAACLSLALSASKLVNQDVLDNYARDVDGDGLPEFADSWNEPLAFYRFATGNTEMQAMKPPGMPTNNFDPLDPRCTLRTWQNANAAALLDACIHPRNTGGDAWYAVSAIVSSGPDRKFGVAANVKAPFSDMAITSEGEWGDNVCSFKIR